MFSKKPENIDSLPGWTTFQLRDRQAYQIQGGEIFMDRYLMMVLQDPEDRHSKVDPRASLLTFDLRNNSIQEVEIKYSSFHTTYTKYNGNQIIKFQGPGDIVAKITIESFELLEVKYKEIKSKGGEQPTFIRHTAEIYNDCLYIYGILRNIDGKMTRGLWSFDLNTLSWKECRSSDEEPDASINAPRSFIIQDNLYIYAGTWDTDTVLVLNLTSMEWTEIERTSKGLKNLGKKSEGHAIYNDHLLVFKNHNTDETNSWSTFDVQAPVVHGLAKNFPIYKNLLVVPKLDSQVPFVSIMNLDQFGLSSTESPEQKHLRSLFMKEEESDVKFKVKGQILHAHKKVLIDKSKYFANLFNSGMSESKQETIKISDCDHVIFQEFLRFLYYGEVKPDEDLAIQLFIFADKYVQKDLREKCLDFLKSNINQDNVYKILDFARQENLSLIRDWCLNFLKEKINAKNISGLVEYLNEQEENPEYAQENLELRDKAINVITNNYRKIFEPFYEDFLIKNLTYETTLPLVKFISGHNHNKVVKHHGLHGENNKEELVEKEKEKLKPHTINLRAALYKFVQRNLKTLTENQTAKQLPNSFLVDLLRNMTEAQGQY